MQTLVLLECTLQKENHFCCFRFSYPMFSTAGSQRVHFLSLNLSSVRGGQVAARSPGSVLRSHPSLLLHGDFDWPPHRGPVGPHCRLIHSHQLCPGVLAVCRRRFGREPVREVKIRGESALHRFHCDTFKTDGQLLHLFLLLICTGNAYEM